jgi:hypothetical protein
MHVTCAFPSLHPFAGAHTTTGTFVTTEEDYCASMCMCARDGVRYWYGKPYGDWFAKGWKEMKEEYVRTNPGNAHPLGFFEWAEGREPSRAGGRERGGTFAGERRERSGSSGMRSARSRTRAKAREYSRAKEEGAGAQDGEKMKLHELVGHDLLKSMDRTDEADDQDGEASRMHKFIGSDLLRTMDES